MNMNIKIGFNRVVSGIVIAVGLLVASAPSYSENPAERSGEGQEARDTKQEGRQDAREDKQNAKRETGRAGRNAGRTSGKTSRTLGAKPKTSGISRGGLENNRRAGPAWTRVCCLSGCRPYQEPTLIRVSRV